MTCSPIPPTRRFDARPAFLALCLLCLPAFWHGDSERGADGAAWAQAAPPVSAPPVSAPPISSPSLVTNATPAERRAAETVVGRLREALASQDANALSFFGLSDVVVTSGIVAAPSGNTAQAATLPQLRLTHLAVGPAGAVARLEYGLWASSGKAGAQVRLAGGVIEAWLQRREGGGFALTDKGWPVPRDAASQLHDKAAQQWHKTRAASGKHALLNLVAERRGGRWAVLRVSAIWEDGVLLDEAKLARAARQMEAIGDAVPASPAPTLVPQGPQALPGASTRSAQVGEAPAGQNPTGQITAGQITVAQVAPARNAPWDETPWLRRQMARHEDRGAGTAHLLLQWSARGWVGLDSVWDADRSVAQRTDAAARQARQAMDGPAFASVTARREFGESLYRLGAFDEAADELEKAEALQPGLVGAARMRQVTAARARDPQRVAARMVIEEPKIGLHPDHPSRLVPLLRREFEASPSTLGALRLGLEYSRLAADELAGAWLKKARELEPAERNQLSGSDAAWIRLLDTQLMERQRLAPTKPSNIIRSTLFTVRCQPNDLDTVRLLAGLEAAQHAIYADFGIPMSNTEVVLWPSQSQFQSYTGHLAGRDTSEFVTALTLTQLVRTDSGPHVLGEEMNFYADPNANTMSTIAHEYGHVAVRHLSKGRDVPEWLNEGIATAVEGGYDNYLRRVREAASVGRQRSKREQRRGEGDGDRAVIDYAQAISLIDYIGAHWGRDAILEILRRIGKDVEPYAALSAVLQVSPQQLWNDWAREGIK